MGKHKGRQGFQEFEEECGGGAEECVRGVGEGDGNEVEGGDAEGDGEVRGGVEGGAGTEEMGEEVGEEGLEDGEVEEEG